MAEIPPPPPPVTPPSPGRKILKYGVPSPGIPTIIEYENHVLEYDPVRRVPKVRCSLNSWLNKFSLAETPKCWNLEF